MARSHFKLPSLSALDTFEAAARHASFKRGAVELGVSPSAVSHQIKALEAALGVSLFDRNHRGVVLNREGEQLFAAITQGFSEIAIAVARLRQQAGQQNVRVSATTAMSHLWLTPRLGRFWREHATVTVNQEVSDVPWADDPTDLMIRYGDLASDRQDRYLLFSDTMRPLVSPAFANANPVNTLDQLAQLPLIHLNAPDRQWTSWVKWFAQLGYDGRLPEGLTVNNYIIALQAAQDGMGVVIGWERMTAPLLETGALVALGDWQCPAPKSFYIQAAPHAGPATGLLLDWLVQTARREDPTG
ncbi:MAG: LysR substrate-binding domain-containing protein [Pseudomonadota bacterium]